MTDQHPTITPPPELRRLWAQRAQHTIPCHDPMEWMQYVSEKAAQWGYDQRGEVNEAKLQQARDEELEVVKHWLITGPYGASIAASAPSLVADLRAARRPKPPTLAEQGMEALRSTPCTEQRHYDALFAALNRLAELEDSND